MAQVWLLNESLWLAWAYWGVLDTSFLSVHIQVAILLICAQLWDPQSGSFVNSCDVPVWSVLHRQRTKQRGINISRLSAHAHSRCVTLNIIKHSPSVTHNTTKHSSGTTLLKQTRARTPGAKERGGGAEEADMREAKHSWCLCWAASDWETLGTRSSCFPYPS